MEFDFILFELQLVLNDFKLVLSLLAMSEMDMYGADEEEEQFYEAVKILLMAIQAVIYVLYELVFSIRGEHIRRPLTRRPVTSSGYIYMHNILDRDPQIFRDVYRMYPDVFRKLCSILKAKTPLRDTRHICVEEMLATFLLVVGQNNRYSEARLIFERSHFAVSRSFNKVLKALNTIAPQFMAKPESIPPNIRESTRFYPYFKDCVGAIDGTHIPATVVGREFIYVISGWEGSAHDSKVLNDAISRRNGLKVPPGKYYLGDCGFPNRRRFLAPFRGLHNFLRQECRSDEFPPEPEEDPIDNHEDNFEWDDFQTQDQQRENANEWRMSIATHMWTDAQPNANNENNDNQESENEGEE
ncbi:protein ALP1-like [Rosa chinensis]|uniref:protein ALP1-like n=1 Tax=Rosa chinensis TaxID=74649 RepID=UPI001AD8D85C|nr:protein ALP1-like [Rosa chinensis]